MDSSSKQARRPVTRPTRPPPMITGGADDEDAVRADGDCPRTGSPIGGSEGTGASPSTWEQRPRAESGSALVIGRWGRAGLAELTSNALRHGRPPVEVTMASTDTSWVLEVSDAADQPPTPAIGRDPGQGGLGLRMVAEMSNARGWDTDGYRKVVWARIDYTSP